MAKEFTVYELQLGGAAVQVQKNSCIQLWRENGVARIAIHCLQDAVQLERIAKDIPQEYWWRKDAYVNDDTPHVTVGEFANRLLEFVQPNYG